MKLTYILLGIVVITAIVLFVRSKTPPGFAVESINHLTKTGLFVFSGHQNSFGMGQGKSVSGRNGYVVTTNSDNGNSVIFKLYKNGEFIKDLQTVVF